MSEINNPLFESQKEFLERQKQEYKNALLSDVHELKHQSQKVGKTLLLAGGAVAGVWLLSTMLKGKKKSDAPKAITAGPATHHLPPAASALNAQNLVQPDGTINYQDALQQEPVYPAGYYQSPPQREPSVVTEITRTFFQSDMAKALSQQVTAFLLVYVTKKIEEYLQQSKNHDIAHPEPETRDIDFSYHQEDAV